jgi:uncharacterized membrane protein YeaQ/YmgE (transglycosylase-associated protein family)
MGFITALIIGGIVGWLASMVMKTNAQMGLIANIVVGIVGSMIGFWAAGLLGFVATGGIARVGAPRLVLAGSEGQQGQEQGGRAGGPDHARHRRAGKGRRELNPRPAC